MTVQLAQQIKFGLWDMARRHPVLAFPIRYAGRLSTKHFRRNHRQKMREMASALLPPSRYLRTPEVPTQCLVLLSKKEWKNPAAKGIDLLLNHLRIPYRRMDPSSDSWVDAGIRHPVLIISLAHHRESILQHGKSARAGQNACIFFNAPKTGSHNAEIHELAGDPASLLPHDKGLRSSLTVVFIKALMAIEKFPVITGFLPPRLGLRIDDVAGSRLGEYLPPICQNGWVPNLGIFIDDFQHHGASSAADLSHLAAQAQVELSPHAFSANRFLFFDYKKGRPLSREAFAENWQCAQNAFASWHFPISPVLNAHFHVFSKSGLPLLTDSGIRYIFSELPPNLVAPSPDLCYLPSGDPLCTTGQIVDGPMQVFSGDSAQDCNQPYSHYDFMMHHGASDPVETAAERIIRRLERSIHSGFAAFVTTHEYLLNALSPAQHTQLWQSVENQLRQFAIPCIKTSLADMGQACFNHTQTVIRQISHRNGQWIIHLEGQTSGTCHLSVFHKNQIQQLRVPKFQGALDVELR